MRLVLTLACALLLSACTSSRKHLERAALYEREGMLTEAYAGYAALYAKRPREVQAHVGMKRTAQAAFDRIQEKASASYMMGDLATGERARLEAIAYMNTLSRSGVAVQWSPIFEQRRKEAQVLEADRLYDKAELAFREDRFDEASSLASESQKLDPSRKETDYLLKLAELEPYYRQGQRAIDLQLWRDAFLQFKRVTDRDASYRDAWELQQQCAAKAQYTLAYVPLINSALYTNELGTALGGGQLEAQLAANVKQAILDLRDPLIVLVDRDNTDKLLAEQQRQMSGVYDDRYGAEAGKLLGARYVLTAKVLRFDDLLTRQIEVQMQVIDSQTGRIHASEIVRVNKQEIGRGAPRAQLLDRAAKRMAARLAQFDPNER